MLRSDSAPQKQLPQMFFAAYSPPEDIISIGIVQRTFGKFDLPHTLYHCSQALTQYEF